MLDKSGNLLKKIASYVPMDTFPLDDIPLPINPATGKQYDGFLIFFDEFNSSQRAVQAASYKVILDKKVGPHNIHPKAAMVCAGNLSTNNAIVNRLSTAMQSRLIHLELMVDFDEWMDWAAKNGIDHRIMTYLSNKPEHLHKFDPNHNDHTFACPRTWEFASRLIKNNKDPLVDYLALLSGTVSEGVAREFVSSTSMYLDMPKFSDIVADPINAKLNQEPAMLYATAHMIAAHTTKHNINPLMGYITRMPIEFETITLQNVVRRNRDWIIDKNGIFTEKCMRDWTVNKGIDVFL